MLSNIAYAFSSAMCRIYSVGLIILFSGQTDICKGIARKRHQFLRNDKPNTLDRFDRENIVAVFHLLCSIVLFVFVSSLYAENRVYALLSLGE